MNSLMVNIFILILHLYLLVNVITEDVIELGHSSCRYSGYHDANYKACYADAFEINKLPTNECTSFIYDGISFTDDSKIIPNYSPDDLKIIKSLTNISSNVFVFYGPQSTYEYCNHKNDTEGQILSEFINEYPVAGLILSITTDPIFIDDFDIKFKTYIECIKKKNPKIKIGLYVKALEMMYYENYDSSYDYSKLNDVLDFYYISFNGINDCSDEFLNGGTTPYTDELISFGAYLNDSIIPKEKVYLEFILSPTISEMDKSFYVPCEITFEEYCKDDIRTSWCNDTDTSSFERYCKADYRSTWCADNETTFYEKGVFAKQYAAGWIGRDIDLIDRGLSCGCNGDQFISFHMILDGYNNKTMRTCNFQKR